MLKTRSNPQGRPHHGNDDSICRKPLGLFVNIQKRRDSGHGDRFMTAFPAKAFDTGSRNVSEPEKETGAV